MGCASSAIWGILLCYTHYGRSFRLWLSQCVIWTLAVVANSFSQGLHRLLNAHRIQYRHIMKGCEIQPVTHFIQHVSYNIAILWKNWTLPKAKTPQRWHLTAKICPFALIITLNTSLKVKVGFIGNNRPIKSYKLAIHISSSLLSLVWMQLQPFYWIFFFFQFIL